MDTHTKESLQITWWMEWGRFQTVREMYMLVRLVIIIGEFKNGKYNGKGKFFKQDGSEYK